MKSLYLFLGVGLILAAAPRAAAAPLVIKNDKLEVAVDPATGRFSLTALPSGKMFVKDGRLSGAGGKAKITTNNDRQRSIVVTYPDKSLDFIMIGADSPFVVFRHALVNDGLDAVVKNRFTTLAAPLALGPPDKLAVLGTGGLENIEGGELKYMPAPSARKKSPAGANNKKNPKKAAKAAAKKSAPKPRPPKPSFDVPPTPAGDELGSYVWLAVADPATRAGVVGAWLTQDRASGVVFPRLKNGRLELEAQLHYGRLLINPNDGFKPLEVFALGYFDDVRLGLEQWANMVAEHYHIKLPPQPVGFCTWYMEKFQGASDERHFAELAQYAAKELKPFGFDFVQIDDGWQAGVKGNGPKKNFNAIDPRGGYAAGMKATAGKVKAAGLEPGIWFMPFAGNHADPFFADKQDLFVKHQDGTPYETSWGGTCLDMTNPKTRAYLTRMVKRIAHDWGYTLFKMDGMWTGTGTPQIYVNNGYKEDGMGDAVFHDPARTNIEAYRAGLKTVRAAAGKGVFLLGCCVSQNMRSLCGAFGLVDAFRIGPDTGAGHIGAPHATRNYFFNGRIWYNDPDCVSVRAQHPLGNARANASFAAISGTLFYNSDWIPDLPAERLDILKRTMLPHGLKGRPVDILEQPVARIWLLSDERATPRRDVVAFFNWDTQHEATIAATLGHIGLNPAREYAGFDFWANKPVAPIKDKIAVSVPADSCVILAVRPVSEVPQLLSTSFHVTQGMVDVSEEKWEAAAKTLSGKSKVVAGDPYELRIALPAGWSVKAVKAGDLKTEIKTEPGLARVRFTSEKSEPVTWTLTFRQ